MFSLLLALVILERSCVTPENAIFQPQRTVSAQVGDSVTLECCTHTDKAKRWLWLKHSPGQAAERIMSTYYGNSQLHGDLRDSGRATVKMNGKSINMTLSALRFSDAAMYYCVLADYDDFLFGGGTFLTITGSECSNGTVIQQPVSEPLQPGDSVTLQCSIHTETCAGEHSVYWFRQASGESLPGIIYTHGNRSDQCERSSGAGSPTQSCVYKLPKRNLGRSDAGTYYCAVATCGEILFGNGTKLDITGSLGQDAVVFGLVAVCMCFLIVIVMLLCNWIRHCAGCSRKHKHSDNTSASNQNMDTDGLNYAALNLNRSKTRTRGHTESHILYSHVGNRF